MDLKVIRLKLMKKTELIKPFVMKPSLDSNNKLLKPLKLSEA
jgi:hypothetical protein